MIEIQTVGTVRVLTFSSGRVNAQDVELMKELAAERDFATIAKLRALKHFDFKTALASAFHEEAHEPLL